MPYSTVDRVRHVLAGIGDTREGGFSLDFGDQIVGLSPKAKPTGTGQLLSVAMAESYRGFHNFTLTFSNGTDFAAKVKPSKSGFQVEYDLGLGSTGADFNPDDPWRLGKKMFLIEPTDWDGLPAAGDIFTWNTQSSISIEMVRDEVAYFAAAVIDGWLAKAKVIIIEDDTTPYFVLHPPAPLLLAEAHAILTAFFVYHRVHMSVRTSESPIIRLFEESHASTLLYASYKRKKREAPRVYARAPIFKTSRLDKLAPNIFGIEAGVRRGEYDAFDAFMRLGDYQVDANHINYRSDSEGTLVSKVEAQY